LEQEKIEVFDLTKLKGRRSHGFKGIAIRHDRD